MKDVRFTVLGTPVPQGSMRGFVKNGKAILTSDNTKLKPYRQQVAQMAHLEFRGEPIGRHVPVHLELDFYLQPPQKRRERPAVKPDLDKLVRAVKDALKGIAYMDDGQVVRAEVAKFYGLPERTEIRVREL